MVGALGVSTALIPYTHVYALDDNALPNGGVVTSGSASFDYSLPHELHVNQSSDRAVIDWQGFNIGEDTLTQFHQPSSSSITVNRVSGAGDPTQILGTLKANGTVMVLDRNGVVFGQNSRVDVGGIIASTGAIDDHSFMAGGSALQLSDVDSGGAIDNKGSITVAQGGLAGFVAPTIKNSGVIQASLGKVVFAAGTAATLDLYGDGLIEVAAPAPLQQALIENTGTIRAQGGKVLLSATAAKEIVDTVINTSGIIDVASATQKGGTIILEGANSKVSGKLDASGKTGGGTILIGGDYQGGGTVHHAQMTNVTSDAIIKASASGDDGDGGKVVLWADDSTRFDGTIEARGGSKSGNGGSVETSGKKNLGVSGRVDASSPHGSNGEWLLDPSNVTIMGTGGTDIPSSGGTINPPSNGYQISDSSIEAALNLGNNVTITTTNAGGTDVGNIGTNGTVSISKTAGNSATLTLKAFQDIVLSNTTIQSSGAGNALNLVFNANNNGANNGIVKVSNSTLTTNGGYVVMGGGNGTLGGTNGILGDGDGTGADDVAAWGNATDRIGLTLANTDITTAGGQIILNGHGLATGTGAAHGMSLNTGSMLDAGSGRILMNGVGGNNSSNGKFGIYMADSGTGLSSSGNITLNGTGATSGNTNDGIRLTNGVTITGTGAGSITLNAVGGNSTAAINATGTASTVGGTSMAGAINITGNTAALDLMTIKTSGTVTIKPTTNTTTIGISGGTGGLNLVDAELNNITAGTLIIGNSVSGLGDMIVDSWDLSGKTYNVELYGNDITFQDTDATPGVDYALKLGSGDFSVRGIDNGSADLATLTANAAIIKSLAGTSTLTLSADRDVVLNAGANITANGGSLNVVLNADRDADHDGAISITSSAITTNGGYVVMGGGSGALGGTNGILGDSDGTGADDVAAWGNSTYADGIYLSDGDITTGSGKIFLSGHGKATGGAGAGIKLFTGSVIETGSGSILARGTGGNQGQLSAGLYMDASGAEIASTSGAIDITGVGGGNASNALNAGLFMDSGAKITSKGAATIKLALTEGTGGRGLNSGTATIGGASASGDVDVVTNSMDATNTAFQTGGVLTIRPRTVSTNINLGGASGGLDLDDTELGNMTAGTLVIGDKDNGTGDIDIDSWDLSGKSHHVQLFGNDIDIGGITTGAGNVYLYAKNGNITASADSLSNAAGTLTLLAGQDIFINEDLVNDGAGRINMFAGWDSASGITTDALFNPDDIVLDTASHDITLGTNGRVASKGTDTAALLAASGDFINQASAGATAITTANGRYLIYADNPTDTIKGGLAAKNLYNRTYDADPPSSIGGTESRFVFKYQPTLTLKADDIQTANPGSVTYTYSYTGLVPGDMIGDAVSGTPSYTLGAQTGNTRPIQLSGFSSPAGYNLVYADGVLTYLSAQPNPPAPPVALPGTINHQTSLERIAVQQKVSENLEMAFEAALEDLKEESNCLLEDNRSGTCIVDSQSGACIGG